jgi:hypothetical protein
LVIVVLTCNGLPGDVSKLIASILNRLLWNSLILTFFRYFPDPTKNQSYVDQTLRTIYRFLIGNQNNIRVDSKLNAFQRKILYETSKETNLGFKCRKEVLEHTQGGSTTKCKCGASGKGSSFYNYEDWHSYSSDSDDNSGPCEVCDESGYVRNFRRTTVYLEKV